MEKLPATTGSWIPEIVDGKGNRISGPELEAVTGLITGFAQLAQLARIRKSLERRHTQGHKVTVLQSATDQVGIFDVMISQNIPNIPWATLRILNRGPSPVYVSINDIWDWTRIWVNEEFPVDFTEANERIHLVAYKCDTGQTANIQLFGTY